MNRFDRLTKRLSAAIVSLLVTALFLQGCSGPVKMIGHTARLIMTETAEGRETDDPKQTETAPAPQENRESAEEGQSFRRERERFRREGERFRRKGRRCRGAGGCRSEACRTGPGRRRGREVRYGKCIPQEKEDIRSRFQGDL